MFRLSRSHDSDSTGLAISDLMMALVAVFLLGSVMMGSAVSEYSGKQSISQSHLDHIISKKLGSFKEQYGIELLGDGVIRLRGKFGNGKSGLTDDFKSRLNAFCPSLIELVVDNYDSIESVVFEGHTSKQWKDKTENTPFYGNKQLSNWRAVNAMRHCLGDTFEDQHSDILDRFNAVGYSYTKPYRKENGEINWSSSKRVDIVIHAAAVNYYE